MDVIAFNKDLKFKLNDQNELLLQGPQVFSGYLGAAPLAESWFNTHDTVEIVESDMFVMGRSDGQVKINGRRTEVQEIEIELEANGLNGFIVPSFFISF